MQDSRQDEAESVTHEDTSAPPEEVAPGSHSLKGPGFPDEDAEVTCPSCGRFAGTYERCPYCGAHMQVRLSVRMLRRLSLLVAFLGLGMIWWAAKNMEVPLRKIGDFSPTMNFAILRIRGQIVAGPYYGDRGDSFYVGVDDGSGRINVKGYGKLAAPLRALDLGRGDRIEARGSIRLQAGKNPAMSLRIPRDLKLLDRAPRTTLEQGEIVTIASLTREMFAERVKVRVRGVLTDFRETKWGRGVTIHDGTGKLVVWVFSRNLERLEAGGELLANGNFVEIVGKLDLYKRKGGKGETLQLRPFGAPDAVQLAEGEPPKSPVAPPPTPVVPSTSTGPAATSLVTIAPTSASAPVSLAPTQAPGLSPRLSLDLEAVGQPATLETTP
jgi:hypothetical protein